MLPLSIQRLCKPSIQSFFILCALIWLAYANGLQAANGGVFQSLLSSVLGVVGAVFANLSGAGGGVVFIPVFAELGLTESQSVATSFAIQSFGMTAGAITWSLYYWREHRLDPKWQSFIYIVLITGGASAAGLWIEQVWSVGVPQSLSHSFSWFSILLGLSLLAQIYLLKAKTSSHNQLKSLDIIMLILIGLVGGVITAWLSVGVGELLVLFLIFRGFCVTLAIASAVVVTAVTVWSAAPVHLNSSSDAVWEIVMYAGPAAIVGGIVAKTIATYIHTKTLKTVLGLWILIMGLIG